MPQVRIAVGFLALSLFLQSHEDGTSAVLVNLPDKLFLVIGAALLVPRSISLLGFRKHWMLLIAVYWLISVLYLPVHLLAEMNDTPLRFQPGLFIPGSLFLLTAISIVGLNQQATTLEELPFGNVFAAITATFFISYVLFLFGIDIDWGLDHSQFSNLPRIQGLMVEPSYSTFIFFIFFLLSTRWIRWVFFLAAMLGLSSTFFAFLLLYALIWHRRYLIPIAICAPLFWNAPTVAKYRNAAEFIVSGESSVGAERVSSVFQAMNIDYSLFGKGLGSSIYFAGFDSTIQPSIMLILYEAGVVGVVLFLGLTISLFISDRITTTQKQAIFAAWFFWFVNSGSAPIFWTVLALVLRINPDRSGDEEGQYIAGSDTEMSRDVGADATTGMSHAP